MEAPSPTTGTDGSHYSLEIPAGALVEEIEIRMTPITSMQGLPLNEGLAAGVQLEPEGMTFYDIVTLTIDPAEPLPIEQTIPIGSPGETGAVYIPFIDPDPRPFASGCCISLRRVCPGASRPTLSLFVNASGVVWRHGSRA